ncbi:hypothetical protein HYH03_009167 [Edaphochlamys debaryana]|uniref:Uncharacterized protein n=1 Tax=Edaphochlamys debaryana TaxID=47281 RepID=A0A835XZK0_9CHLO|nr:hypothetical protein HYH03_009167 [Edaphochlamys debaryana]|eukprot:KAG2492502.1 hypothetical protein HYH03_009167 [Edaphochlamys debaryana]
MASTLFTLARRSARHSGALLAMAGTGLATVGLSSPGAWEMPRVTVPGFTPSALADAPRPDPASAAKVAADANIALTGFEAVKDSASFVSYALDKALRHAKSSPLQGLLGAKPSGIASSAQEFGEIPAPTPVDPAAFYSLLARQPLSEKLIILDDIVDSVIREAERSAEASALTVGMVGGGVACYALAGWWADLALPGAGTVACSAVAGAAGHSRAKHAAKRTRTRFLNAILQGPAAAAGRNSFVDYLAAPSLDVKQRIASDVAPAQFFADFYVAVQPLLKSGPRADSTEEVLNTAA